MKAVIFGQRASAHNNAITARYREISYSLAIRYETTVDRAVGHISRQPQAWPFFHKYFRKFILKPFPYALAYREFEEKILIFEVVALRREPGYWLG